MIVKNRNLLLTVETTLTGEIISMSESLRILIKGKPSTYIDDLFPRWNAYGNEKIKVAFLTDEDFLLFIRSQSGQHHYLYIGILSSELSQLMNKVSDLMKANTLLEAIIENSYDGIYLTDRNGNTILTNSAMERITGIPKDYYMNKKVDALIERGILESSLTKRVIEKKETISHVQFNRAGNESLLLTGSPVFDDTGEVESVVTNIRDLSQLIELQNALKEANKLNLSYRQEIERLKQNINIHQQSIVIESEKMKHVYETAERIVNVDATVLLLGDTGVGKDVLAKYIYETSNRRMKGKYIKLNCGAIPEELIESELFGYEKGAFTGADKQGKPGMFELADEGVLFLDEIGELPLASQVKLLRVIQEKEIQRVGGTKTKNVNVRLIAATNRDLKEMVNKGLFREDLYYRLNVITIEIPSLKDRREDIYPLIEYFLKQTNEKYHFNKDLHNDVKKFLYHYQWPGNIRELANLIERLVIVSQESIITMNDLPPEYQREIDFPYENEKIETLKDVVEAAEKKAIMKALKKCTTTYELASALHTSQPTISRKLKKYGIELIHL
ncbi:sigma 54-interacting transcriptional regulator [Cytobacillus sp. FSL R5-0569]|uniref:sigma-54 interaction domain-containing protein n=1 Tax=unclassified Cytobacillus TaxID=2675268 RepID=UPI0030FA8581